MTKSLVIVESKAKAKTISQYLGKDYTVTACMGHIRDLPKNTLGIDVKDNFKPRYLVSRDRKNIVDELKESAKKADEILLATDPDREGEAIAWHLVHILKSKKVIKRIEFNEITKKAVREALDHAREIDQNKVDAQQARRILDRLVGYSLSPYLWREIQGGLSAGRVQSVALRLICERENEIEKFIPQEYWSIDAIFKTEKEEEFSAELTKFNGNKVEIPNESEVKRIIQELKTSDFAVEDIKIQEKRKNPLPPFITSTLQQEASRKLRFPPRKTMQIAQRLYEGIKIGSKQVGLITYMRTDSFRIADEAVKDARSFISQNIGKEYLPDSPNEYKSKKRIQDAHEAIRPTDVRETPESLRNKISNEEFELYDLIWRRFVACQMAAGIDKVTTIIINGNKFEFRTSRTVRVFQGYRKVWEENNNSKNDVKPSLPELNVGDNLTLVDLKPEQHFTEPPPRYSSATLIKTLEELGIGRPSTYAPTVSILLDRKYVDREKGYFFPTPLGRQVDSLLLKKFPTILDYQFTARMEDELDEIMAGEEVWQNVVKNFYGPFYEQLTKALDEKCPKCESHLMLMNGPFGSYLACSSETCDYKKNLGEKEMEEKCPDCGKPLIEKLGRYGRFIGCTGYPDCKYIRKIAKTSAGGDESEIKEIEYGSEPCPACGNRTILRKSRMGRFFGCEKYPNCKGTIPYKIGFKCPKCAEADRAGELIERRSRKGKLFYSCSVYPDCDYVTFAHPLAGKGKKPDAQPSGEIQAVRKPRKSRVLASEQLEDIDTVAMPPGENEEQDEDSEESGEA
jgi:DNA topoisomerase-1